MGKIIFFSGLILLAITIALAIYFGKKPLQYVPDGDIYPKANGGYTQPLRSGYPTNRLTLRRKSGKTQTKSTEVISNDNVISTMPLADNETQPLAGSETMPLTGNETMPLAREDRPTDIL